jgi:four helix bundle protein
VGIRRAPSKPHDPKELKDRTKRFAVAVIELCRELPATLDAKRVGGQLIDSATSVAANYRAACRARSRAEFIAKLGTVLEEADESPLAGVGR